MEFRKFRAHRIRRSDQSYTKLKGAEIETILITKKYLLIFMITAISLELLDLIFRGYTAVKSWDILRAVIYELDFNKIFIMQYGLGNLLPFILLLLPRLTIKRAVVALMLVMFGVFMMRWNVVIGGQLLSKSLRGFVSYTPTLGGREGVFAAITLMALPFWLFAIITYFIPPWREVLQEVTPDERRGTAEPTGTRTPA